MSDMDAVPNRRFCAPLFCTQQQLSFSQPNDHSSVAVRPSTFNGQRRKTDGTQLPARVGSTRDLSGKARRTVICYRPGCPGVVLRESESRRDSPLFDLEKRACDSFLLSSNVDSHFEPLASRPVWCQLSGVRALCPSTAHHSAKLSATQGNGEGGFGGQAVCLLTSSFVSHTVRPSTANIETRAQTTGLRFFSMPWKYPSRPYNIPWHPYFGTEWQENRDKHLIWCTYCARVAFVVNPSSGRCAPRTKRTKVFRSLRAVRRGQVDRLTSHPAGPFLNKIQPTWNLRFLILLSRSAKHSRDRFYRVVRNHLPSALLPTQPSTGSGCAFSPFRATPCLYWC